MYMRMYGMDNSSIDKAPNDTVFLGRCSLL